MCTEEVGMTGDITLTVDDGEAPDAANFFSAGVHLLDLLDDLSETASVDWSVTGLRLASAVSDLTATGDFREAGAKAARSAVSGLLAIQQGKAPSDDWTPNATIHAKELVIGSGFHAKLEASGNVVWLDQRLRERLEGQAPWVREFYGSVRGELTGVNVTRGNRASVKPQGGGRVVHVGFPSALAVSMRDALLSFVEVEGMIRQNEDGRTYYVTAESVRTIEQSRLTWRQLRGYMPEITDGLSVADYLEVVRGKD